jgi:hypothetical protein
MRRALIAGTAAALLLGATPALAAVYLSWFTDPNDVTGRFDIRRAEVRIATQPTGPAEVRLKVATFEEFSLANGSFTWVLDSRADGRGDVFVTVFRDSGRLRCTVDALAFGESSFGRVERGNRWVSCAFPRTRLHKNKALRWKVSSTTADTTVTDRDPDSGWAPQG